MKPIKLLLAALFLVLMQGCAVAALVMAASFAAKNSEDTKMKFQELNLEREKAGLEPITWDEYRQKARK